MQEDCIICLNSNTKPFSSSDLIRPQKHSADLCRVSKQGLVLLQSLSVFLIDPLWFYKTHCFQIQTQILSFSFVSPSHHFGLNPLCNFSIHIAGAELIQDSVMSLCHDNVCCCWLKTHFHSLLLDLLKYISCTGPCYFYCIFIYLQYLLLQPFLSGLANCFTAAAQTWASVSVPKRLYYSFSRFTLYQLLK